tara:strand:+ start:661 stop:1167 length:507 start_codon:yes stop_codon:yes gene_type:complete
MSNFDSSINLLNGGAGFLGFIFKADINNTRESLAIDFCKNLIYEFANLIIHHAKVSENQITKNPGIKAYYSSHNQDSNEYVITWKKNENIFSALLRVDAILILSELNIYKNLDWNKISKLLKPAWFFETRAIVNISKLKKYRTKLFENLRKFRKNSRIINKIKFIILN